MKKYWSFGCGVNSVAGVLLSLDRGEEFEAIFVNHGGDWPETYEYFELFQEYLVKNGADKITVLTPQVKRKGIVYSDMYKCYIDNGLIPLRYPRWCTADFKVRIINNYIETPCFSLIGIDSDEAHRAKISSVNGVENRYPLIEAGMSRQDCKDLIKSHGLPIPMKSGCFFCPFQRISQFQQLRRKHPKLFCKVEALETNNLRLAKRAGKKVTYIKNVPIRTAIKEYQRSIFEQDEYPPCQCGL